MLDEIGVADGRTTTDGLVGMLVALGRTTMLGVEIGVAVGDAGVVEHAARLIKVIRIIA
jgi:hypothetical protein